MDPIAAKKKLVARRKYYIKRLETLEGEYAQFPSPDLKYKITRAAAVLDQVNKDLSGLLGPVDEKTAVIEEDEAIEETPKAKAEEEAAAEAVIAAVLVKKSKPKRDICEGLRDDEDLPPIIKRGRGRPRKNQ